MSGAAIGLVGGLGVGCAVLWIVAARMVMQVTRASVRVPGEVIGHDHYTSRGRVMYSRLRPSIGEVAAPEIVQPVERVLERHAATRVALSRAAAV